MKITTVIKNILPYGISNSFLKKRNILRLQEEIPSSEEPLVYNAEGQKLKTVFLSDYRSRDWPYSFVANRYSSFIFWDRYNYGLKNHVYSHEKILDIIGKPIKQFAFFLEGESIDPKTYTLFDKHPGLVREFDLIFTHYAPYLEKYSNAVLIPGGGVYYGTLNHGGSLSTEQYKVKTKNISLVSSEKTICELHKFRLELARYFKNSQYIDTYGTFDGGSYVKIADTLACYRYSIAIENDITDYRFTEKILNCFASMTIPIYIGAKKIGDFFNPDGIIQVSSLEYDIIDKIIKECNEENYMARIPAILDNYNRVQDYLCIEDYIWTNYNSYFV